MRIKPHQTQDKLGGEALEMSSPGLPSAHTFTLRLKLGRVPLRLLSDMSSTRSDGSFASTGGIAPLMLFPDNAIISKDRRLAKAGCMVPLRNIRDRLIPVTLRRSLPLSLVQ